MKSKNAKNHFEDIVFRVIQNGKFCRFDRFIICFLGYDVTGEPDEGVRRGAYHELLRQWGTERNVTLPTIRKWFGIQGFHQPSREQVIQLCFELRLGIGDAERFLREGIGEPSFQVNDYSEIIAMYVLENRLGQEKYESLLKEYETKINGSVEICKESNTQWLFNQFQKIKNASEQEFLRWMWENASQFKGYSKTVQEYLEIYRKRVVEFIRSDVKKQLELLLSETGYPTWREKKKVISEKSEGELIKRYLAGSIRTKKTKISADLRKNILELTNIVYSETGYNTLLLSELFTVLEENSRETKELLPDHPIKKMSGKYVSDLFNIPYWNERMINVRYEIRELENKKPDEACPPELVQQIQEYSKGKAVVETVEEAGNWLMDYERKNERRRLLAGRNDLLPLIFYVAQRIYLYEIGEDMTKYNRELARKIFCNMADAVMLACNMDTLHEEYLFDAILLACYQEDRMYSYADILSAM